MTPRPNTRKQATHPIDWEEEHIYGRLLGYEPEKEEEVYQP